MSRALSGRFQVPKELEALRERLADVFETGGGAESERGDATEAALRWTPSLDIVADLGEVLVSLETPGLAARDLLIELSDDVLTIRGERERVSATAGNVPAGTVFHRLERAMGPFERIVPLPGPVDPERVEARIELGVLTVRLWRAPQPIPGTRQVRING